MRRPSPGRDKDRERERDRDRDRDRSGRDSDRRDRDRRDRDKDGSGLRGGGIRESSREAVLRDKKAQLEVLKKEKNEALESAKVKTWCGLCEMMGGCLKRSFSFCYKSFSFCYKCLTYTGAHKCL